MKTKQMFRNLGRVCRIVLKDNIRYFIGSSIFVLSSIFVPFINIYLLKFLIEGIENRIPFDEFVRFIITAFSISLVLNGIMTASGKFSKLFGKFQLIPMVSRFMKQSITMDFQNTEDSEVLDEMNRATAVLLNKINLEIYLEAVNGILIAVGQLILTVYIIIEVKSMIVLVVVAMSVICNLVDFITQNKNYQNHKKIIGVERRWRYLLELIADIPYGKTIRLHDLKDYFYQKGRKNRDAFYSLHSCNTRNNFLADSIKSVVILLQELAIFAWLVFAVLFRGLSISNFTLIFNTASQLSSSLASLSQSIVSFYENDNYINDFFTFIDRKSKLRSTAKPGVKIPEGPGEIVFRNVGFRYSNSHRDILKNVNLTIRPGERITVIGENGAGKTTLIKLLMRLYDVTSGEITYHGINIRDFDYDEYMDLISTVFQDFKIFAVSIYENIVLREDYEADKSRLDKLMERCGISEKVNALPQKGETIISKLFDDRGIELSGGQLQKISMCRSINKDSPVFVLDEPTANLSPIAEYNLYRQFHDIVSGKTAIFISHRLSSSQISDNICLLQDGEIAEYGSHDELMQINGTYAEMYRLQSEYYIQA